MLAARRSPRRPSRIAVGLLGGDHAELGVDLRGGAPSPAPCAWMCAARGCVPLIGKFSTARWVWARHSASFGTCDLAHAVVLDAELSATLPRCFPWCLPCSRLRPYPAARRRDTFKWGEPRDRWVRRERLRHPPCPAAPGRVACGSRTWPGGRAAGRPSTCPDVGGRWRAWRGGRPTSPGGTGGREPHVLSVGCVLLAAAFRGGASLAGAAARRHRAGPRRGAGRSWSSCLTAPTGWAGGDDAASYAFAAELGLVVLGLGPYAGPPAAPAHRPVGRPSGGSSRSAGCPGGACRTR